MPCRFGEEQCTMRLDAVHPSDTIDLAVRLENDDHVLRLADTDAFPDLHALWASRADVPEPVLLALVEKNCGPLFQLVENAVRRQFSVVGLVREAPVEDTPMVYARITGVDGADKAVFALTLSSSIVSALGELRYIDVTNPGVRAEELPAEREFASFSLPAADATTMEVGDALLLPEIGSAEQRIIVDGRFAATSGAVSAWKDDGLYRVVAAESDTISLGALFDIATGAAAPAAVPEPAAETRLRLVRMDRTVASGRFVKLGGNSAFAVDATGA